MSEVNIAIALLSVIIAFWAMLFARKCLTKEVTVWQDQPLVVYNKNGDFKKVHVVESSYEYIRLWRFTKYERLRNTTLRSVRYPNRHVTVDVFCAVTVDKALITAVKVYGIHWRERLSEQLRFIHERADLQLALAYNGMEVPVCPELLKLKEKITDLIQEDDVVKGFGLNVQVELITVKTNIWFDSFLWL